MKVVGSNIHVSTTKRAPQENLQCSYNRIMYERLVCELSLNHLAIEASDVGDGLVLRADSLAGAGVGAVTETEFVHLGNHVLHTTGSLYTALGKQGELANLR